MTTHTLPETSRDRLRWALREGFVIAGIVLFWLGVAVVLVAGLSLLGLALRLLGVGAFHLLADLLRRTAILWPALSAVAVATVCLYVVVRGGTLLIDHHAAS